MNLKWDDVDFGPNLIIVRSSPTFKTRGEIRRVPLNATAVSSIEERRRTRSKLLLFHLERKNNMPGMADAHVEMAIHDAGIEDDRLHFHSLRHTFASWLVQDGASLFEVQKLMGYSSGRSVSIKCFVGSSTAVASMW